MNTTPNYGLRKPEDTDLYNVEDFNYNMDIIDNIGSGGAGGGLAAGRVTSVVSGTPAAVVAGEITQQEG